MKKEVNIHFVPVTLSIDPLIAKYLHFKPAVIDSLSKEIQVSISVNDSQGTITISQTDSSPPDWPSTSTERLQYLLSEMLCRVDVPIPQSAATQLYPIIMQQCAERGLQYAVSVAGDIGLVAKLQQNVHELCSRTVQQAEVVNLNPEDYAFFKGYMLPIVQKKYPSLKMKCHDLDNSLSADGSIRDVVQLKEMLPQYLVHYRASVSLQPPAIQFLQTEKGSEILQSILRGTKLVPFFTQPSSDTQKVTLLLLSTRDEAYQAENVAMKVADQIQLTTISLPKYFQSHVAQGPKFASQKESLFKKYAHLSVVQEGKLILVSTADILPQVSKAFDHFITEECSITANIHMKKGVWRLLHSSMEKRWTDLVGEMRENGVTIASSSEPSSQKPFVKIKGEPDKVEAAKEKIQELQESVEEHEFACPGICRFLNDPIGQMFVKCIESDAGVCIEMGVKAEEGDKLCADDLSSNSRFTHEDTIHIYGPTYQSAKSAEKQLILRFNSQFVTQPVSKPIIATLSDDTVSKLEEIANSHSVDIHIDRDLHFIRLHGYQSDVRKVNDKVLDVLADVNQEKIMRDCAKVVFKFINWVRNVSEEMKEVYDEVTSFEIEQAYQRKIEYESSNNAKKFVIDFETMEERDLVTGDVVKVLRVELSEGN